MPRPPAPVPKTDATDFPNFRKHKLGSRVTAECSESNNELVNFGDLKFNL
jgi:hypothetical protein